MRAFTVKWRPTLGMVTAALIAGIIVLPLVSLLFVRLYENELVRQAEGELIAQAAMLSAVYARAIEHAEPEAFPVGLPRPARDPAIAADERYAPIAPTLDLAVSPILPARPQPEAASIRPTGNALQIGEGLTALTRETQMTTLAGFRLLNAAGVVIAGREDIGASFAGLEEVREAMAGRFRSVMRLRDEIRSRPPLYSISRGTNVRVYVAMPVFVDNRVRGIVYVSRTPDNILRQLYQERAKVEMAALLVLAGSALIGAVFVRTIARPMRDLTKRAEEIMLGRREAIGPLAHHGTQELASLTQSLMTMAKRLSERSDYLSTFATHVSHELKTPLTSMRGAAELMLDASSTMTPEARERFLTNMLADAARMSALLDRLRELARADNPELGGSTTLEETAAALRLRFADLDITLTSPDAPALRLSSENAAIVFTNLLDNSVRHGAKRVVIEAKTEAPWLVVCVRDDGEGVSAGNQERIFDPFFTTRRAGGGTGMGLGIVSALVRAHGGTIGLADSVSGAAFELRLPLEEGVLSAKRSWFAGLAAVARSLRKKP